MNQNQSCKNCGKKFEITDADLKFYDKVSPSLSGKKYLIPIPQLCPDCRQQRRLAFRNERKLYNSICGLCKKPIISIYSPDKPYTVYCHNCWWNDGWDGLQYGREFDFNRPFFDQFNELKLKVPHLALHATNNENSDYVNLSGYNKNCYLIFASEYNENCLYGTQVIHSEHCLDTLNCLGSRYCYELVNCESCYQLYFSKNCKNTSESMFLDDCRGCTNCLFSTNLRNKKYYIFNKSASKEEYEKKKQEILVQIQAGNLSYLKDEFAKIGQQAIHRNLEIANCENSLGDYLSDSKNVLSCFNLAHAQDCKYVSTGYGVKDLMDVAHTTELELSYEGTSVGYKSYNVHFALGSWTSNNSYYVDNVHSSSNLFGSIGLRKGKYCILNKQYNKEEYEKMVGLIIEHMKKNGEWGEFFPVGISAFGYNETLAQEYYSLNKEQASAKSYKWKEEDTKDYQPQTYKIPLQTKDVPDSITKEVLVCGTVNGEDKSSINGCGRNFKIVQAELNFYRQNGLHIPQLCPDCRHKARRMLTNPRMLWKRPCAKCQQEMQTTFAPERPETVYCEKCYLEVVY